MKIVSLQWDRDNGGMACGPVDGSSYVSLCLSDDEREVWLMASQYEGFLRLDIAGRTALSLAAAQRFDELEQVCDAVADFEIPDTPEEQAEVERAILTHSLGRGFLLAIAALAEYTADGSADPDAFLSRIAPARELESAALPHLTDLWEEYC